MPSYYTVCVQDGSITDFRDFAMLCARGMGACVSMRDDPLDVPIPDAFVPSIEHYDKRIEELSTELVKLRSMDAYEKARAVQAEFDARVAATTKRNAESDLRYARYEEMLAKVQKWHPPTPDHNGLKEFMIEQLSDSMRMDCFVSPVPKDCPDADEWNAGEIERVKDDLSREKRSRMEEIARTEARNLWVRHLRMSLPEAGEKA